LLVLGLRQAEEQQAAQAQARGFLGLAHRFINRQIEDSRHGAYGAADAFAGTEKEGIDQVAGRDGGFAHQRPQGFRAPQPAHPRLWEAHGSDCIRETRKSRTAFRVRVGLRGQANPLLPYNCS
jgi:hypothetical protein